MVAINAQFSLRQAEIDRFKTLLAIPTMRAEEEVKLIDLGIAMRLLRET